MMNEDKPKSEDNFGYSDWSEHKALPYNVQYTLTPLERLSLSDLVALRNMGYATVQKEIDKRIKEIFE